MNVKLSRIIVMMLLLLSFNHLVYSQKALGDYHFHKGDTFLLFNKHDSSLYQFEKAREIYVAENYWRGVVSTDNKIAENLCGTFDLLRAMKLAKEAYDMADMHLGEWDIEKANALNNIGNIHYLMGQHELALKEYDKALSIANHEFHEEVLFSAPTSLGIGNVYFGKHQYEEAFKHFQTALEANINILGEEHPYVANSYLSLGNLYRNKGSYNLSMEYYEHALSINTSVLGENHPDVGTTYIGIADIYNYTDQYDLAMEYYQKSLDIYEQFLHEKNPKYGSIYLGFADIYKNQGDFIKAHEFYQKALDLYEFTIGLEHQNSVRAYLGLGNTFMYQEDYQQALSYYNLVLDVNFKLAGENHVNSSIANNNLGSIYYYFGNFDQAVSYFKKSLDIDIAIQGNQNVDVATGYYNLARVYGERGDVKQALDYVQKAINASIINFNNEQISSFTLINYFDSRELFLYMSYKLELLENIFAQSSDIKRLDKLLEEFILIDELIDRIRLSYTDRRNELQLKDLAESIYESSVNSVYRLTLMLNEKNVKSISESTEYEQKIKEYRSLFFFFTEKRKGLILSSAVVEANAKSYGGVPETMLYQEKELKELITNYTQELAANPDSTMLDFYQRELISANREYEDLIYAFEYDYPKYYDLKYDIKTPSLEDVQQFLDDSTMMITYYLTKDSIYISQIENQSFRIDRIRKNLDYDKSIKALRKGILDKNGKTYSKYASSLYKELFPMQIPDNIKSLIIVQDGVMSAIPFEVLLTEEVNSENIDYGTLSYLVRDYNISYTFSGDLIYNTFNHKKLVKEKASKSGMMIAPVTFAHTLDALTNAKQKSYKESGIALNLRKEVQVEDIIISSLISTEQGADAINVLFKENGKEVISYTNSNAKEELAKSGEMSNYNYVHIASHAFVNQEEPEFSGVIMASSSTDSNQEDGILFSGEVYDVKLNAELVTLPACETGLGQFENGRSSGSMSLSRALIYAGAKNIAFSLWKGSDDSTKNLVIDFYSKFLNEQIPAEPFKSLNYAYALKESKLKMINEGGEFAHPYYWSSFVLIGK